MWNECIGYVVCYDDTSKKHKQMLLANDTLPSKINYAVV